MKITKTLWLLLIAMAVAACGESNGDDDKDGLLPRDDAGLIDQRADGLVINEVSSKGDDEIELYNRGAETIDLTGFYVTDEKLDIPTAYVFPSGTKLGPGEYLVLRKGEHHEFGLGNADAVALFAPDHELVDKTEWVDGEAQISWCRMPNGTGDFKSCRLQTFGRENSDEASVCGDGVVERPEEVCDGEELGGANCEDFGFGGGTLACSPSCASFDTSACTGRKSDVVINEVTSQGDDNIELLNIGDAPVDLSGWIVSDDKGLERLGDEAYIFPEGTVIAPGEYLVLVGGVDHLFGLGGDDEVNLYDADENLIDRADWPVDGAKPSFCRIPNGTGDFQTCSEQTFGAENISLETVCGDGIKNGDEECDGSDLHGMSCASLGFASGDLSCSASCTLDTSECVEGEPASAGVVINEVTSQGDDNIELLNIGDAPVDLSGWIVSDDKGLERLGDDAYIFPEGTIIAPGEYLVLVGGVDHLFGLGGEDEVNLYDADEQLIDRADWPADGAKPSFCRIPNGTGDFETCSEQSFGVANAE